jgi:hypothetical protein
LDLCWISEQKFWTPARLAGGPAGDSHWDVFHLDLSLTSLRTGRSEAALQQATEAANAFGRLDDKLGRATALDCIGVVHCSAWRPPIWFGRGALALVSLFRFVR